MIFLSNRWVWIPVYIFLAVLVVNRYQKRAWLIIPLALVCVTIADQTSSALIKNIVQRPRPCYEEKLASQIHLIGDGCGGKYGFISSHASNTFMLATFISLLMAKRRRIFVPILFTWAFLVSYSRIYLGVHYPGDVISGMILGSFIGWLGFRLYIYLSKKIWKNVETLHPTS